MNDFDWVDGDQMKLGCFVLLGVVHFCEVGVHFSVSGNFFKALNRRRLRFCFFALFIISRFIVCCLPAHQTQQSLRTAGNSGLFRIVALRVEGIFFSRKITWWKQKWGKWTGRRAWVWTITTKKFGAGAARFFVQLFSSPFVHSASNFTFWKALSTKSGCGSTPLSFHYLLLRKESDYRLAQGPGPVPMGRWFLFLPLPVFLDWTQWTIPWRMNSIDFFSEINASLAESTVELKWDRYRGIGNSEPRWKQKHID